MSISVVCDDCGKAYTVADAVLGKRVKCKSCGNAFIANAQASVKASVKVCAQPGNSASAVKKTAAAVGAGSSSSRAVVRGPVVQKMTVKSAPVIVKKSAPPAAPSRPVNPFDSDEPDEYAFKDDPQDWEPVEATMVDDETFTPAGHAVTAVSQWDRVWDSVGGVRSFLSQYSAGTLFRGSALLIALLFILATLAVPAARTVGVLFFSVATLAYFVIAMVVTVFRSIRDGGRDHVAIGAFLLLLVAIVISALARRPFLMVRRIGAAGSISSQRMRAVIGNSCFLLLMLLVVLFVPELFLTHPDRTFPLTPAYQTNTIDSQHDFTPQQPTISPSPNVPVPAVTDQVVTVRLFGMPANYSNRYFVINRLRIFANANNAREKNEAGFDTVTLSPVTDVKEFAAKIDFGGVTVSEADNSISVIVNMAGLNALIAANVPADSHPPQVVSPGVSTDSISTDSSGGVLPLANQPTEIKPMPKHALPGLKVAVLRDAKWWAGMVIKIEGRRYQVHYEGQDASHDEWVGKDRIQPAAVVGE